MPDAAPPGDSALDAVAERCSSRGVRGVVAAVAADAAAVGIQAIRDGGNAYDAAVCAALAETVLVPPKAGLAGDLVALCLRRGADEPIALIAVGPSPRGLGERVAATGELPLTGPLSVGVPGAPAGYAALAQRGRLGLARLAEPAIALARDGVAWAPICAALAAEAAPLLREHNPRGSAYLPDSGPLEVGAAVRLPGLARVLEELAARGEDLFAGAIGDAVAATVAERGGVLAREDLASARADWAPPARAEIGGRAVWATPAPTHGVTLLDALARASSARTVAQQWAAVEAARRESARTLGDAGAGEGTSVVAAADAEGNAVVVVHSNSFPQFGSGLVVPGYDLLLNNRAGRGFSADPRHPNAPAPGRRPATTLHAWALAAEGGRGPLLGATPGGEQQVVWNTQLVLRALRGYEHPGRLVLEPLWERGSGDAIRAEAGFAAAELEPAGGGAPALERTGRWALRCAHQLLACPAEPGGALMAVSDLRIGGSTAAT